MLEFWCFMLIYVVFVGLCVVCWLCWVCCCDLSCFVGVLAFARLVVWVWVWLVLLMLVVCMICNLRLLSLGWFVLGLFVLAV